MFKWLDLNIKLLAVIGLIILPLMISSCNSSGKDSSNKAKGDSPVVLISTSEGDIKVKLNKEEAPITVENFLGYVNDGYYDGIIFHRVIPNFMIQTGGFTPDMKQKTPKAPIKNEANNGLLNNRGTLSMARTSEVDSATSQFFINVNDNNFLNNGERQMFAAANHTESIQPVCAAEHFVVDTTIAKPVAVAAAQQNTAQSYPQASLSQLPRLIKYSQHMGSVR